MKKYKRIGCKDYFSNKMVVPNYFVVIEKDGKKIKTGHKVEGKLIQKILGKSKDSVDLARATHELVGGRIGEGIHYTLMHPNGKQHIELRSKEASKGEGLKKTPRQAVHYPEGAGIKRKKKNEEENLKGGVLAE